MNRKEQAELYLKEALKDPGASFREGQWEGIEQLLNKGVIYLNPQTEIIPF